MTTEYIKEAYLKLRKKLGRQPSQDEFYEHTTVTYYYLLKNGFRTFSQLVEVMGDTSKTFLHGGKTEEEFFISYGNMVRKLKHIPSTPDWNFHKSQPAISSYRRKFNLKKWENMASKFYDYAKDKSEWEDIIRLIPKQVFPSKLKEEKESEECYVYLMYDTKTLCHKIGISSLPDWRERTLQSEKPSIKLVAAKQFVNRRMAASFEKALHDSYSHKRKRGEWFRLDSEDVDELKITLTDK